MKECWDALNSMGANKSLGNDGLSNEFGEIHTYLVQVLNHSFSNKQPSNSQRQAMITLIEKGGKDKKVP